MESVAAEEQLPDIRQLGIPRLFGACLGSLATSPTGWRLRLVTDACTAFARRERRRKFNWSQWLLQKFGERLHKRNGFVTKQCGSRPILPESGVKTRWLELDSIDIANVMLVIECVRTNSALGRGQLAHDVWREERSYLQT